MLSTPRKVAATLKGRRAHVEGTVIGPLETPQGGGSHDISASSSLNVETHNHDCECHGFSPRALAALHFNERCSKGRV